MEKRPALLFFGISDYGYVNVILATIYELLRENQVDIHLASFPPVQPRLSKLVQQVKDENPNRSISPVQFHNLTTFPGFSEWAASHKDRKKADVPHPRGRYGATKVAELTLRALTFMKPEHYLSLFDWSLDLTQRLDPALVVVDPILLPVHDMARKNKRRFAVIHPWNVADGLIPNQPWLAKYWKYPAFSTGFSYPVPLISIPENVYCYLNSKRCQSHQKVLELNKCRQARGIEGDLGMFTPWAKDALQITPSIPEIDLPMVMPSNVINCGPILVGAPPIESSDPELCSWLKERPTVLISLGTHFEAYVETVRQQAIAIRSLLETRPDVQVLWKLKIESSSAKRGLQNVLDVLEDYCKKRQVRVEQWLKADPIAILQSGHIVCTVHHGGANSYYEATWAGVPQVVLSMWYDTFDYATRVEYLGIGVYANKHKGHKPVLATDGPPNFVDGDEFARGLLKVIGKRAGDANAESMKKRAMELGKICRESGGRATSAKVITDLCLSA